MALISPLLTSGGLSCETCLTTPHACSPHTSLPISPKINSFNKTHSLLSILISVFASSYSLHQNQVTPLMEEVLWDLEDKLNLSTQGAFLLLAFTSFALVAICTLIILKRKARKNKIAHQEGDIGETETSPVEWSEPRCGWVSLKSVLMGSMRWSKACKWEEKVGSQRKLIGLERHGVEIGRHSNNSVSAVWQRPILRGEKCELPSFSGLILYDEKGKLLRDSEKETSCNEASNQEKEAVTVRTTLRDLL